MVEEGHAVWVTPQREVGVPMVELEGQLLVGQRHLGVEEPKVEQLPLVEVEQRATRAARAAKGVTAGWKMGLVVLPTAMRAVEVLERTAAMLLGSRAQMGVVAPALGSTAATS